MHHEIHRHVPAGLFLRFLLERPRALSIGILISVLPVGILFLIAWLVSSMDGTGPDFDRLLAAGAPVNAEVVAIERVTRITINSRNPVRITYRYRAGGAQVTDAVQTMAEAGYLLREGERVTALVRDGDSILPDFPPVAFPAWAIAVIDGVFLLMGLPFLLYALHGAVAKRRLYRRGRPVRGEVEGFAPAFSIPLTATRMQVAFSCITDEGRALKGTSVVVFDESWRGKKRGSAVTVLVGSSPDEACCVAEEAVLARCPESVR